MYVLVVDNATCLLQKLEIRYTSNDISKNTYVFRDNLILKFTLTINHIQRHLSVPKIRLKDNIIHKFKLHQQNQHGYSAYQTLYRTCQ